MTVIIATVLTPGDRAFSGAWHLNEPIPLGSGQRVTLTGTNVWSLFPGLKHDNPEQLMREDGALKVPLDGVYLFSLQTVIKSQSTTAYSGSVEQAFYIENTDGQSSSIIPLALSMSGKCSAVSSNGSDQYYLPAMSSSIPLSLRQGQCVVPYVYHNTGQEMAVLGSPVIKCMSTFLSMHLLKETVNHSNSLSSVVSLPSDSE